MDIVAVFPNDAEMVRQFVTKDNLRMRSLATVPLEKLHVNATPTLILVDKQGRVECCASPKLCKALDIGSRNNVTGACVCR